jgi:hypothetical protein
MGEFTRGTERGKEGLGSTNKRSSGYQTDEHRDPEARDSAGMESRTDQNSVAMADNQREIQADATEITTQNPTNKLHTVTPPDQIRETEEPTSPSRIPSVGMIQFSSSQEESDQVEEQRKPKGDSRNETETPDSPITVNCRHMGKVFQALGILVGLTTLVVCFTQRKTLEESEKPQGVTVTEESITPSQTLEKDFRTWAIPGTQSLRKGDTFPSNPATSSNDLSYSAPPFV